MALKVGELFASLGLDTKNFDNSLQNAGKKLGDMDSKMSAAGKALSAGVTAPLVGIGAAALKAAGNMEQSEIAFTSMLGSAQQATGFIAELRDFAAKTPFELPGLISASRRLLAFGFDAKSIIPMMTSLGDAVAALGGGEAEINRVSIALGQMKAKGKVSAEEVMQLAELGIPAWEMLANKIGVGIPEAMKMAEKGAITADQGITAILEGMNNKFGGMMSKQSQTLLGLWSSFKDNASATLTDIGTAIMPVAKKALESLQPLIDGVSWLAKRFAELPGPAQTAVVAIGGFTAAIGPGILVLGQVAGGLSSIIALIPVIRSGFETMALRALYAQDAMRALAASSKMLQGVMAFFSGPAGWITLAAVAIFALIIKMKEWVTESGNVRTGLKSMKEAADEATAAMNRLGDSLKGVTGPELNRRIRNQTMRTNEAWEDFQKKNKKSDIDYTKVKPGEEPWWDAQIFESPERKAARLARQKYDAQWKKLQGMRKWQDTMTPDVSTPSTPTFTPPTPQSLPGPAGSNYTNASNGSWVNGDGASSLKSIENLQKQQLDELRKMNKPAMVVNS